jgi:hypothetical protein
VASIRIPSPWKERATDAAKPELQQQGVAPWLGSMSTPAVSMACWAEMFQ